MATQNDVKPKKPAKKFESKSQTLIYGGPSRQHVKVEMGSYDIIFCVSIDDSTLRVLHLQNVSRDNLNDETEEYVSGANVEEALCEVEKLLDELKSLDDSNKTSWTRPAELKYEHAKDWEHAHIRTFIQTQAKERGLEFDWDEGGYSRWALEQKKQLPWWKVSWSQNGTWSTQTGLYFSKIPATEIQPEKEGEDIDTPKEGGK